MELKGIKSIHFIGICGYIMSATAAMLKKMGYRVTGSDQDAYPPGTTTIDKAGINWSKKYDPINLDGSDLVVVGNHIRSDNPEAQAAIKKNLTVISLPELIGKIFADERRIVIAGTHGKTTTTSLIAWVLQTTGLGPSYLVGGIMQNTGRGFKLGKGDFFVVEGDEYRTAFFDQRPKFLHYQPEIAVLTTCELDHPDYFNGLNKIKKTFSQFLNLVPENGLVVAGIDDVNVAEIIEEIKFPKISYGLTEEAECQAYEVKLGEPSQFKVKINGKFFGDFSVFLPGIINIQNSLAAIAVAHYLKVSTEKIKKAISTFKGVKRRFEIVGQARGVTVVDDYAHHPTKIKKTLAAARSRYPKNKLYCVFEPHTYSRTKALLTDYAKAFGQADEVIVAELMPSREADQTPSITSEEVVKAIKKFRPKVQLIPNPEKILAYLRSKVKPEDVVMVMSVGGLNNLARRLVDAL